MSNTLATIPSTGVHLAKYQLQQQFSTEAVGYSIAFPSIATASVFKDRLDWKLKILQKL